MKRLTKAQGEEMGNVLLDLVISLTAVHDELNKDVKDYNADKVDYWMKKHNETVDQLHALGIPSHRGPSKFHL